MLMVGRKGVWWWCRVASGVVLGLVLATSLLLHWEGTASLQSTRDASHAVLTDPRPGRSEQQQQEEEEEEKRQTPAPRFKASQSKKQEAMGFVQTKIPVDQPSEGERKQHHQEDRVLKQQSQQPPQEQIQPSQIGRAARQQKQYLHGQAAITGGVPNAAAAASTSPSPPPTSEKDATFLVFVMVSSKDIHFAALVDSLLRSDLENGTRIVISYDGETPAMKQVASRLRTRFGLSQMVHPYACATAEERHGFPKYDSHGQERKLWQYSCPKHHWFWAMHRTWSYFTNARWLYYLEEDFIVSRHIGTVVRDLMTQADKNPDLLGAMTQCRDNLWTVSGLMKRSTWEALLNRVEFFCRLDDYNWDLSMKQTFIQRQGPTTYLCPEQDRVYHSGIFGKGLTHGKRMETRTELHEAVNTARLRFYAQTDALSAVYSFHDEHLHTKHRGLGAFDDSDADHCLRVHRWFQQRD